MLAFLAEPHSLAEMAKRRFVYRPNQESAHVDEVEHRTAFLHLQRMLTRNEVTEVEPGRYQRRP
jgi:adenylate cyclase class IV